MTSTSVQTIAQQNGNKHSHQISPTQSSSTSTTDRDEFDSEAFESDRVSLPYLQMLNHQDPNQAGFFFTLENAEAVKFQPTEEWTQHTTTFQNGETVEGYRSLIARFLILRQSKLLMFDRESGEFISEFRKSQYDRNLMVLKIRYLVYLVSKDKRLLHTSPLLLTTKGSFCGSFGETVKQFRHDMSKAYGAATGAKRPRGDRFMALSVLALQVQPELKGDKKKSWTCSVAGYGVPTIENWQAFFVGYQADLKERVLAEFEAWSSFGKPEQEIMQQKHQQVSQNVNQNSLDEYEVGNFDGFDYGYPEEI